MLLAPDSTVIRTVRTQGINPFHQDADTIAGILSTLNGLLGHAQCSMGDAQRSTATLPPDAIYFYGSGVRPEQAGKLEALLHDTFPTSIHVEAHGDLLGAARALLGANEGIACILGTGANSCLYDGHTIVANTPPLGYILGDEGSGAVLGRNFLNALYKGQLSAAVADDFHRETSLTLADVIDRVYRQPLANRWLASLSPFIHERLCIGEVRRLVVDNFMQFLIRNVVPYQRPDLPVSFIGSMAWYYQAELSEAVSNAGLVMGKIAQSPLQGLAEYHR
jgi:N-acetylglucosamine kinase-like BadF-type ATPase